MERITIRRKGSGSAAVLGTTAPALMDVKGRPSDSGMSWGDWNEVQHFEGLTPVEIKALKLKHKTPTPNLARALDVKSLMVQGMKCGEITRTLRAKWGERMMRADHSALSPIVHSEK
jgi:hypothetical protein